LGDQPVNATWSVIPTGIVNINPTSGTSTAVTAIKAGTATITASYVANDGAIKTGTCLIEVSSSGEPLEDDPFLALSGKQWKVISFNYQYHSYDYIPYQRERTVYCTLDSNADDNTVLYFDKDSAGNYKASGWSIDVLQTTVETGVPPKTISDGFSLCHEFLNEIGNGYTFSLTAKQKITRAYEHENENGNAKSTMSCYFEFISENKIKYIFDALWDTGVSDITSHTTEYTEIIFELVGSWP
jgi:hypothetical protein